MGGNKAHRIRVALQDDFSHGRIDLVGECIGSVTACHQIPPQEDLLIPSLQGELTDVTHAETGDHLTGYRGHLLNVATGSSGDFGMAKNDVFGSPTTESSHDSCP